MPSEPAAPAPATHAHRWRRTTAVIIAGVVLGGLVAWAILGALGSRNATPAEDRVIEVGDVSLSVPSDWLPARSPSSVVPDLGSPTAVLDPYPGLRIHAVVLSSPRGIPPALSDLVGPLGTGRTTQLAGRRARAYAGRAVRGNRIAELTVARTSAGVLIVACIGPTSSWAVAAGCADSVGSTPAVR